jgi:hypothetical protein
MPQLAGGVVLNIMLASKGGDYVFTSKPVYGSKPTRFAGGHPHLVG